MLYAGKSFTLVMSSKASSRSNWFLVDFKTSWSKIRQWESEGKTHSGSVSNTERERETGSYIKLHIRCTLCEPLSIQHAKSYAVEVIKCFFIFPKQFQEPNSRFRRWQDWKNRQAALIPRSIISCSQKIVHKLPDCKSSICINMNDILTPATAKGYSQWALLPSVLCNRVWNEFCIK